MQDILEKIDKKLQEKTSLEKDDFIKFSSKDYIPKKLSDKNFHNIEIKTNAKIAFIDGGNAELLKAPNFSLQFIRTFAVIIKNNKRIKQKTSEFYALTTTTIKNDEIHYNTELFPIKDAVIPDEKHLLLSSFDKTLTIGSQRASISSIGDIARRFAELELAKNIIDELNEKDIIVLDGALEAIKTNENKYLDMLYKKAEEKKVLITALSKTTTLMTEKGNSVIGLLQNISPKQSWYYYPVAEINNKDHKAELFFIKLHERSEYIFRFEIYKAQAYNYLYIIGSLANNANDLAFPGYPYGLIFADRFARISNQEKEYLKTMFLAKSMNSEKLRQSISTLNAHQILDNIA